MKTRLLLLLLFCASRAFAQQITITQEDMPNVKDTLRQSLALPTTAGDFRSTGTGHTWDFRSLTPVAQTVDRFVSINSTSLFYQLVFNVNPNRATIASPVTVPEYLRELAGNLGTITIEDPILFYQESPTAFQEVGFGATVGGIGAPVKYEQPDVLYRFPLTYGTKDSSTAFLVINNPALQVYYAQTRKRVNHADGWGTLSTPFGSFPVLRVVSTINVSDTVRTAQIPATRTQRPVVREYKWLGKNQGVPLLQITTTVVDGQERVVSISYRDIYRNPALLSAASPADEWGFRAYPSPLREGEPLHLNVAAGQRTPVEVSVFDPTGKLVYQTTFPDLGSPEGYRLPAQAFGPSRGLFLVRLQAGATTLTRKILRL